MNSTVAVKTVQSLYFSPTGNTKRIVEAIVKGIGLQTADSIDLTLPGPRESWSGAVKGNLLIIGVPIHAHSFPSLILPSLKKLDGEGLWAVPVAVSGNAQMRTCLTDLAGVLKKRGFMIPAAANFVGEHSFSTDEFPMGVGRPDRRDLRKAVSFGNKIAARMENNPEDITSIRGENIFIRTYLAGDAEAQGTSFPERYQNVIRVSEVNGERCNNCGRCIESCPTGAIDVKTLKINNASCIRCFACTSACPTGAVLKVVNPDPDLKAWFRKQGSVRAEPQIFL